MMNVIPFVIVKAQINYRMPDHPRILQEFVYELLDILPELPELHRFLGWWQAHLDGKLFHVHYVCSPLVSKRELRYASADFRLQ